MRVQPTAEFASLVYGPGGVDEDSGADGVLAHDERGLRAVLLVRGPVAGDQDLNDGGRDFGGEAFECIVELHQGRGGRGGFVGLGGGLWLGLLGHQGGRGHDKRGYCDNTLRGGE